LQSSANSESQLPGFDHVLERTCFWVEKCAGRRLAVICFLKNMQMEIETLSQSTRVKVFLVFPDVAFLSVLFQENRKSQEYAK